MSFEIHVWIDYKREGDGFSDMSIQMIAIKLAKVRKYIRTVVPISTIVDLLIQSMYIARMKLPGLQ